MFIYNLFHLQINMLAQHLHKEFLFILNNWHIYAQNYPGSQQGMYGQSMPPPNKVAPPSNIPPGNMYQRDMYSMGTKRHNEYSKGHGSMQDQYHMGNYPQQQSQGPYGGMYLFFLCVNTNVNYICHLLYYECIHM